MADLSAEEMLASVQEPSAGTETPAQQAPVAPTPQAPWWQEKLKDEVEYEVGGRVIKEPLEMLRKRAGMGYNYAQHMHAINAQKEHFAKIEEDNKKLAELKKWQEYDDYARANPEWADHVDHTWKNKANLLQSNQGQQSAAQLPPEIIEKLKKYDEVIGKFEANEKKAIEATEDKQMADEINTIAKDYGEKFAVDLKQADENGVTLQWRVLDHMKKLGFDGSKPGQFGAAFRDLCLDNLLERQRERVKEEYAKSQAELKKAGILDKSRTPKQPDNFNGYRKGMTDSEKRNAAVRDLEAMMAQKN